MYFITIHLHLAQQGLLRLLMYGEKPIHDGCAILQVFLFICFIVAIV